MKISTLKAAIFLFITGLMPFSIMAQTFEPNDEISMMPGYVQDVYYNFTNGEIKSINRAQWDLAFMVNVNSAISVNTPEGLMLYKTPYAISEWTSVDTAGIIINENRLVNDPQSWFSGAFNRTMTGNPNDIGWAEYDFNTHQLLGDSLYVLKLRDTTYKKIAILSRIDGSYEMKYADLDGGNEVTVKIPTKDYVSNLFVYYRFEGNSIIPAGFEPDEKNWDVLFCKYMHEFEEFSISQEEKWYGVTGVLLHPSLQAAHLATSNRQTAKWKEAEFTEQTNIIGYDWKEFDMQSFAWVLDSKAVYFVIDKKDDVWKLIFTDFEGSSTGVVKFYKENLGNIASRDAISNALQSITVYPNPAIDIADIVCHANQASMATLRVLDLQAKTVFLDTMALLPGLNQYKLDLTTLVPGAYTVTLHSPTGFATYQLMVTR